MSLYRPDTTVPISVSKAAEEERPAEPQWVGGVPENLTVRVRYRSRPVECSAPLPVGDGRWLVALGEAVPAITPGQSAVFYVGKTVAGGAFIADQRGINQWINRDE